MKPLEFLFPHLRRKRESAEFAALQSARRVWEDSVISTGWRRYPIYCDKNNQPQKHARIALTRFEWGADMHLTAPADIAPEMNIAGLWWKPWETVPGPETTKP